jgi:hypothetical protein
MHLVCLDHDPPLVASGESGQHWRDVPRIREEIAHRESLVTAYDMTGGFDRIWASHFTVNTVAFLAEHPKCRIGIRTEYGEDVPLVDDGAGPE